MVRVVSLSGAVCSWLLREKSAPRERKETCRGSQGGEKGTGAFSQGGEKGTGAFSQGGEKGTGAFSQGGEKGTGAFSAVRSS
jgi:hypothetical protein